MIKAVIIDDEPKGVFTLSSFLQTHCPQVVIAGTAHNAAAGKELILLMQPNLVFLDVEMPMGSGFALLGSFPVIDFEIVFITAYNQYAINAFRFSAVDYLLKPIRISLLVEAVAKVEQRIMEKKSVKNYELLLRNLDERDATKTKIALTDRGIQYLVQLDEILYFAGSSNYTHIHTKNKTFLSTKRLKDFEEMVPVNIFCRIHNSYFINIRYIVKVVKGRGGSVVMQDGAELEIAFRRRENFNKMFSEIIRIN